MSPPQHHTCTIGEETDHGIDGWWHHAKGEPGNRDGETILASPVPMTWSGLTPGPSVIQPTPKCRLPGCLVARLPVVVPPDSLQQQGAIPHLEPNAWSPGLAPPILVRRTAAWSCPGWF